MLQPKLGERGSDSAYISAELAVRQLLANGKPKVALDRAKELHKTHHSPASEALLIDAYMERVQSLLKQDMFVEAKGLMDLIGERYPSSASRLCAIVKTAAVQSGKLEDLLRSLGDPSCSAEERTAIEQAIERNLHDLSALANCDALSPEHSLRQAAISLQKAFEAVTSGPVEVDAIALPEMSRRSPLASWKMLVWAIASYYRGEKEATRQYLAAIKPDSAPARCIPSIEAMLEGRALPTPKPSAELVSRIAGDAAALSCAVQKLDAAVAGGDPKVVLKAIAPAVDECRRSMPEKLERLRQHIWVRCNLMDMSSDATKSAIGGSPLKDAYFYRLYANGLESSQSFNDIFLSCSLWDQFYQAAVKEGWIPPNGPEAATIYLRIAKLLHDVPLARTLNFERAGTKSGESSEDRYFLNPSVLYQRASQADPHAETFGPWLKWAKKFGAYRADPVADSWHKTRPGDLEPVLHLMESFESRNAYPTALQYLAKAENIDGVSTEVRRARMRLMAGSVVRYIQQKKPDLALKRIEEIAALPQAQQGDRPAYLVALRYEAAASRNDSTSMQSLRTELERLLQSPAAAALFHLIAGRLCKRFEPLPALNKIDKKDLAFLPTNYARLSLLSLDMQFDIEMPGAWMKEIGVQFGKSKQPFSVVQLREIGRGCLKAGCPDIAYKVSANGLELGNAAHAEFLLMRAGALPRHQVERRQVCAAAAAELARQNGDLELAGKAAELLDKLFQDGSIKVTSQQAAEVVQMERKKPKLNGPAPSYRFITGGGVCDCPECRRQRQSFNSFDPFDLDGDDLDGDVLDEDNPFEGLDIPADMPPAIAAMLLEETQKAVLNGQTLDDLIDRFVGMGFPAPPGYRKKSRKGGRK